MTVKELIGVLETLPSALSVTIEPREPAASTAKASYGKLRVHQYIDTVALTMDEQMKRQIVQLS